MVAVASGSGKGRQIVGVAKASTPVTEIAAYYEYGVLIGEIGRKKSAVLFLLGWAR